MRRDWLCARPARTAQAGSGEARISVSLVEALELTPANRREGAEPAWQLAVRWLTGYLQERDPTIHEIALVVGSLVALPVGTDGGLISAPGFG